MHRADRSTHESERDVTVSAEGRCVHRHDDIGAERRRQDGRCALKKTCDLIRRDDCKKVNEEKAYVIKVIE